MRARAQRLFSELDHLTSLRREARQDLIVKCRRHPASKLLLKVPTLGIVRIAQLISGVVAPHRLRSKRQFWAYCGADRRDEIECRPSRCRRTSTSQEEVGDHARLNAESQPHLEVCLQERGINICAL